MTNSGKKTDFFNVKLWQTLAVFVCLVLSFVFYVQAEREVILANKQGLQSILLADELRQTSDDLTRMVRTYVATGDPIYKKHFYEILAIRNGQSPRPINYHGIYWDLVRKDDKRPSSFGEAIPLLEMMRKAGFTEAEFSKLEEAKNASEALALIETNAINLIDSNPANLEQDHNRAIHMLYDEGYHQAKYKIMKPISEFFTMVETRSNEAVFKAEQKALLLRVVSLLFGIILIVLLWTIRRNLQTILGAPIEAIFRQITLLGKHDNSESSKEFRHERSISELLKQSKQNLDQLDAQNKETKQLLQKNLNSLETAQRIAHFGSWEWDINSGGLSWSDEIYRIFGLEPGQFEPSYAAFMERVHPDDRQKVQQAVDDAVTGKHPYHIEHRVVHKTGEEKIVVEEGVVERDASGKPVHMLGVVHDITTTKNAERLLKKAKDDAEAANKAKSEFLANMSHELRTPLTSIRGAIGLVLGTQSDVLPLEQSNLLEMAERNAKTLSLLINDLLELEKIDSGQIKMNLKPVDLISLAQLAVKDNEGYAMRHGVNLRFQSELETAMVKGDDQRLAQVFANLISNAVKYSPPEGQVDITVTLYLNSYRVSIHDRGEGIPEAFQAQLFERFTQADTSTTRRKGGTGLGLNICKAIIDLHHGHISFVTGGKDGTTFFFELSPLEQ